MKNVLLIALTVMMLLFSFSLQAQTSPDTGDVNGNGAIDIIDALMTAQHSVGLGPSLFYAEAADVDGSGQIDIIDALIIARFAVGLINTFPAEMTGMETAASYLARNTNPQPADSEMEELIDANNRFAFDCYRNINGAAGNVLFSPISISYAMAMCYAGARGITKTQMAETMNFTLPGDSLHNALNKLDLLLTSENGGDPNMGENLILKIVNAAWGQKGAYFNPSYLDTLALNYGSGMNLLDYISFPEPSRLTINQWVEDETEQRIKDLLPGGSIDSSTRLVLTNAVYFKAVWYDAFLDTNTDESEFYLADGSIKTVPTMFQSTEALYMETENYQAVKLIYEGSKRNSMMIFLPAKGKFEAFEKAINHEYLEDLNLAREYDVYLSLPKFSFEWSGSLVPAFTSMGMEIPFKPGFADFTGINDGEAPLFISDILHKTYISVDEKGTEAAAATAAVFYTYSSGPPMATMNVNRPFIFVIYNDDTGSVLFMGRVMEP